MISEKYQGYIKDLLYISFPTCIFLLFLMIRTLINIAFLSSASSNYKAIEALGLTDLYMNCSTYIIILGISGGFEILGSNYYGDKNYHYLGITLIKAKLITLCYFILITTFNYFFSLKIIGLIFNVEEEIIHMMKPYLYLSMIYLFFMIFLNVDFRYLSIIGKSYINTITLFIASLMHPIFNYIFINKMQLELLGCGISNVLIQIISTASLIIYIKINDPLPGSFISITSDCFKNWGEYLKICSTTTLMLIGEFMGFEVQALIVMYFSSLDYTVHIVLINIQLLIFTFTLSINISMSINVAEKCISYSKERLIEFVRVSYLINVICLSILIFFLYIFQNKLLTILTTGDEMKRITENCFSILFIFLFTDNGYFFFGGVLKGFAYLLVPAIITVINFYFIQISLSWFFCLHIGLGVKGIWISLLIGSSISYILQVAIFMKLDIDKMKNEACERINIDDDKKTSSNISPLLIRKDYIEMSDFDNGNRKSNRNSNKLYHHEF